jgi:adenylyltransferase/sulfurtransferase
MYREIYEKYSRQILFAPIGEQGQIGLLNARAVLVGCGALGTSLADILVRAGVGHLRIVDRDFVEASNLQRQTLFTEEDAREALPKAIAAQRHLIKANSSVRIEGIVADLRSANMPELLTGHQIILDGTDNFETRFLLNEAAIKLDVPWVYGAAVASYGVTMTIRPGQTPCLACLIESGGEAGADDTCDTAGVLGPIVGVISSLEAVEAVKILSGNFDALHGALVSCDVWSGRFQSIRIARNLQCRTCVAREFPYLEGKGQPHVTLCGRDSVQIHEGRRKLDLATVAARLAATATEVRGNAYLLRFRVAPYEVTVFADGRAIIKGTRESSVARSVYARYVGA